MAYRFSRFICVLICRLLFRIRAYGRESIPESGGFILASNHVSYLDPVVLGVACRRTVVFMARDNLFKIPLLGAWLRAVKVIALKRKSADFGAIKAAIRAVINQEGLALFPEGTRQQPGAELGAVEEGVGFIAAKCNAPVIPVYISGTEKAMPRGARFIRPTKINVYFGKQIHIERGMPYHKIAGLVMAGIRQVKERLTSGNKNCGK